MKKKILSLIFATTLVASVLTACGSEATSETATSEITNTDEVVETHVTGDAPASEDSAADSTASNVDDAVVMASEIAAEKFGADGISAYDMKFTPEALNEYQAESSSRGLIANRLVLDAMDGSNSVYNPANYSSTLDMISDAQANSIDGNIFGSGEGMDEQIANAVDALVSSLGTKVVVMTTFSSDSSMVMFYCDNGNGYGVESATDESVVIHTGAYADNAYMYNIYPDGTVNDFSQ